MLPIVTIGCVFYFVMGDVSPCVIQTIGDTFQLGSQVWRVIDLTDDRVVVAVDRLGSLASSRLS